MANDNTRIASASQDVVGIFDSASFNQLFTNARAIKAKVNENSSVMSHPVEDGSTVTDHTVILPIDIELSMIISSADYRSVYESIKSYFIAATLLIVQTRSGTYRSMIISNMPHDEDPEMYDALTMAVKLQEVKFAKYVVGKNPTVSSPKNSKHSKTSNSGKQQPTETKTGDKEKKQSVLKSWLS